MGDMRTTTRLLNLLAAGDPHAAEELAPIVYGELHRMAAGKLGGQAPHDTLHPTALVSEAWIRLAAGADQLEFEGRERFFALASRIMRSVLVDHARARQAEKRGGDRRPITLVGDEPVAARSELDVLEVDEALQRMKDMDPELHRLVELRFFGGLSHPEIARLLGISLRTVERNWRLARAWLHGELA
jgi:RNA polymerase sigma factor (TIGR02999 family)